MKKKLSEFTELAILRRNEKLHAECCYVLSSESVASCTYFETKRDVLRAHKMFERHLSPVMDIIQFLFTPSGWMLTVTIKSEEEILAALEELGYSSQKMKNAIRTKNISVIISECIRYAISGIARITNRYNRRFGTLVRRNFSRYIFLTVEAAINVMNKMKEEQIKLCCKRERYRPSMTWYNSDGKLRESGDVFLCSKNHGKVEISERTRSQLLSIVTMPISVLHKIILGTLEQFQDHSFYKKSIISI